MSDPTTDQPIPNDNNELHSDGVDALSENYIFTALRSTNSSLNTIVSEVIDSFQDQNQALNDLCCLILLASGCNSSINTEAFQDVDLIPDALGLVEKEFKTIKLVKCKGYSEFWVKLVIKMKNKYLFEGDLLDIIVQWIASISSSGVRVLRHNGTIAALGVITGLATLLQSNIDSTLKLQSKKVKEAVNLKKELVKEKQVLESFVSKLFNGVFVHRFRDVCNLVRGDCIKELGLWMLKCPSLFLESSYLRYFGWMLSDSSTNVRLQCLKSLNNLVKPAHFSNLRPFFERFKQRILQIAGCEREASVRVCGVRLVGSMANMAMFDDEEMETVLVLVLDQDERVRTAIAPTIVDYYNERCQGVEVQDLPRIKTFLQLAIQISKTAYQTQKQTELETKQSFNDPNLSKIVLQNPSANSIRMENSSQIIWGWLAKEARDEDETVGSNNMIALVTAVYEDLSILSKVEIMADYLLEEDALTTEEEHCLVYIMTASISIANQNKKKKAYTEMQNCIVNSYVPLLAKYSKEFNGPTMGLLKELVITLGSASADWYQGRKVGSSMEDVVSALLELYKRNCNSPLLKEIANTIVNFTTQNPALEATITAYLNSTSEFLSNLLQDMDGKSRPSSEDIDKCCSAVSKLYHFSTVYDISDHSWKTGDTVLEFFLVCLANDQSDVRLAVLLQQNIEIMARDVLRRANQAYKQDSQIKLDTDDENSFIQEYQKILKFCEAVVCDNVTKANISFNHLHKLHCTNILVDLSRFCNGPIHTKFPQLKYDFGPELAMLCAENLEQVVYICAFMLDESLTKISEQVMLEFGIEIQRLFSGLTVLSKQNIAPYKHLGRFLCYYGLDYQVEDYYAKTDSSKSFEMFGKVWDDLCTGSIESLMRSFLQNVDHVYKSDLNAYEKLIRVEDRAKDLATCIQSALGGSVDLFLTLRIPSLSAPLALAKLFVAKLVSMSKDFNMAIQNYESTFAQNVKQILCNVLLKMYQIGMTENIDRLQEWSDTVARANYDGHVTNMTTIKDSAQDCIFTRAEALVDSLSKANECWKVWSLIANCISSHFQFLSSTNATEIVNPETIVQELSRRFEAAGIKTDNSSDNWKHYYSALESISGDKQAPQTAKKSRTKSAKPKKRSRTSSSEANPPADRRKSSRLSTKILKSFTEMDDSEDELSQNTPKKRDFEILEGEFQESPVSQFKRTRED